MRRALNWIGIGLSACVCGVTISIFAVMLEQMSAQSTVPGTSEPGVWMRNGNLNYFARVGKGLLVEETRDSSGRPTGGTLSVDDGIVRVSTGQQRPSTCTVGDIHVRAGTHVSICGEGGVWVNLAVEKGF